ncbi:uncharacterized protein IL334_003480 [Kwoniella shivajii]|uniref:Abscisic acid G-protein coupled receptor-domain-containing protein n=1 Tax=Kwoniella shivajii TaxID=564305 RepID=A0ABZ1CXN5_9TREE|nr:hypothetical protein IL334_003480 [Kwoniella shivajii]
MEGQSEPISLTAPLTSSAPSPILFDTLILLGLRVIYFFLSRRFLLAAVNPRLRTISEPEQLLPSSSTTDTRKSIRADGGRGSIAESDLDTEDEALLGGDTPSSSYPGTPTRRDSSLPGTNGKDYFPRPEPYLGPHLSSPGPSTSSLPSIPRDDNIELQQLGRKLKEAGSGVSQKVLQLSHGSSKGGVQGTRGTKKTTRGLHRVSRILFGVCFAEGCNLLTLVIFHAVGLLHSRSRRVNFSVSLHVILAIVLLIVPLVQCLLLTYRSRASLPMTTRLVISLIPFTLYIFLFTRIPPYITAIPITPATPLPTPVLDVDDPSSTATTIDEAIVQWSTSGPEGWEQGGWLAPSLGRVVVLGVLILGSLSGFGAVRSAWNFFEHAIGAGSRSVSDFDILQAERSLYRVRHDLVSKREEISRVSAASGTSTPARGGWMGRMFGGQSQEVVSLEAELSGLKTMEYQVSRSLKAMKLRKKHQEFGHTMRGQLYNLFGYVFAIYCAARLIMCLPSLFFAPLTTSQASSEAAEEGKGNTNGDWISFLLALAISKLPTGFIDIDVPSWSRAISIILTGVLILSSLAQVMRSLNKVLRLTSKTVGAGFLLLSLGQLFATYVISLLVQLRTSLPPAPPEDPFYSQTNVSSSIAHLDPSQTDHSLLSTLPDFRVFGRLFDVTFLFAAATTAVYRYIAMKVAGADDTGEIYRH